MGNHKSAVKRQRQNEKRNLRNREARSALRSAVKDALSAAQAGKDAKPLVKAASRLLDKAATKGLLKRGNASRRISRLQKAVNAQASTKRTAK